MTDSSNLDLVRSIYRDWERGDYSAAEWAHPQIEHVFADGPDPGAWEGLAAMAEAWRDRLSTSEAARIEADEYRELDGERILVLTRGIGRGKKSGLELRHAETQGAHLFHVRQGKVTRFVAYWDRDRALADVGLAPEGDAP